MFDHTVLFVEEGKNIMGISTANGECVITFFLQSGYFYSITNLFTTAAHENVQIYYGIDRNLFLEFKYVMFCRKLRATNLTIFLTF